MGMEALISKSITRHVPENLDLIDLSLYVVGFVIVTELVKLRHKN